MAAGLRRQGEGGGWRGGGAPEGSFTGTVSDKPNQTRIGADGKTVVNAFALASAPLPARAALHRQARVLRVALVELAPRSHIEKALPRVFRTIRWWRQLSQRPAFMRGTVIAPATIGASWPPG